MKKKQLLVALLATVMVGTAQATGSSAKVDHLNKFVAEYTERSAYIKAGSALNKQICEEGMVLLKNRENVLPFSGVSKVSVFGKASTDLQLGGGGSGSGSNKGESGVDLQKSLTNAGYKVNPSLTTFYNTKSKSGEGRKNGNTGWTGVSEATIGETPVDRYDATLKASFDDYNDAAILVLARGGTEGADCKTIDARDFNKTDGSCSAIKGDEFTTKHYLQLSDNESDLLDMIEEKFDKVVVLINSGNIFQCDRFEKDDKVSAVIWMGTPGAVGTDAVGEILSGKVNPSGRTVDTWARDFTKDPTFQNFADNSQTGEIYTDSKGQKKAASQDTMFNHDGTPTNSSSKAKWDNEEHKIVAGGLNGVKPACYVSYEEGIYVDYRYYETRYADMEKATKGSGDTWYAGEEGVIYPFGYGLSYTSFEQTITEIDPIENTVLTGAKKKINVTVKVKNTGNVAGKDVVQVYWKAPYKKGGIEKPYEVLAAFGKTDVLEPNEEQEVKCSFYLQDVASYDFDDKNHNGFKGYELDAGDYYVSINKDAHTAYEQVKVKVKKGGIQYENDRYTGHKVENRFSNNDFFSSLPLADDVGFDQMSREDFKKTFPSHPTIEDRTLGENSRVEEFLTHKFDLADLDIYHNGYVSEAAYKTEDDIKALGWSQQTSALAKANRMQLSEMVGVALDDPKWDTFLNEFTYSELQIFVEDGQFHNPSLDAIGKRQTRDSDGPSQYAIIWWAGAPTVAATYNVDLAKKQGEMIGTEAHIQDQYGWLGNAVNTHRSPFGGRNFEYYSADPFLMGRMAAEVIKAVSAKGVYSYFKHFAVNDQEKNREGTSTFVTEQALREIYLRPFQMVVQEGKSMGIMSSYNRLGNMETAASYPLLTEVLREEWGFKGAVLSDMTHHGNSAFDHKCYENINNRVLSGCNAQLDNSSYRNDIQAKWQNSVGAPVFQYKDETGATQNAVSYSWWYAVRVCAKEVLYAYANSGGMDKNLTLLVNDKVAVAGETDGVVVANLGEESNIAITSEEIVAGGTYKDKTVTEVTMTIDPVTPLPAGLTLENGVIKGTATKIGEYRINILIDIKVEGTSTPTTVAKEITMFVVDPLDLDQEKPVKAGLNTGAIVGISVGAGVVGVGAIAAAVFFVLKKKKESAAA